jgi:hypothetical protein
MRQLWLNRLTLIWVLLVAATTLSWAVGHGVGLHDRRTAGVTIIGVAMLKSRYILLEFMELRGATLVPRLLAEGWVLALAVGMIGLFLRGG